MCGIVGMIGDITPGMRNRFKDFLDVCQLRGRDSTGVIHVDRKGENYSYVKQVGPPLYLYDTKSYDTLVERTASSVLVGHCRHKTSGEVNRKNAHPFDFPDKGIIGVHNGTLRYTHKIPTYSHSKVDSEMLYEYLAETDAETVFSTIDGAWACIWWNDQDKTINFIRNNERPLYLTWSEDMRIMFFASERWMFNAVSRGVGGITFWAGNADTAAFEELPADHHYSFRVNPDAPKGEKVISIRQAKKIEQVVEKKPYISPVRGGYNHSSHPYGNTWVDQRTGNRVRWCNTQKKVVPVLPVAGGEVADPFQKTTVLLLENPLPDDTLPESLTNSDISNVAFLKNSATTPTPTAQPTSTKKLLRPTLSLPVTFSKNSQQKTSDGSLKAPDECSDGCNGSQSKSLEETTKSKQGSSVRVVVGVRYITDHATGVEYSEEDFVKNTTGHCMFCKSEVLNLNLVGNFIDKKGFICKPCLTPSIEGVC